MKSIEVQAIGDTTADAGAVYTLLKDSSTYPAWSRIGSFEAVRPGRGGPHEAGARRIFHTGPIRAYEEIVELVPNRRLSYVLLSGLPLRDYKSDVDLEPLAGGGTRVRWHSTFRAKIPGTGWFWRAFMSRVLADMVTGVCEAARQSTPGTDIARGGR